MQAVFLWKLQSLKQLKKRWAFHGYMYVTSGYTLLNALWGLCYANYIHVDAKGMTIVSFAFFVYSAITMCGWFHFTLWCQNIKMNTAIGRMATYIPFVFVLLIMISNCWTRNAYHVSDIWPRFWSGKIFWMLILGEYSYFIFLMINSIRRRIRAEDKKSKRKETMVFLFSALPLFVACIQIFAQILPHVSGSYISIIMTVYGYVQLHEDEKRDLKEAIYRAERADKAKLILMSNISHDIKTPLTGILGYAKLAAKAVDDNERVKDYLEKITASGNHMNSLISGILDMNMIETGKIVLQEKSENLIDLILEIRMLLQMQVKEKGLRLYTDVSKVENNYVYCDKLKLKRCLLNVIGNAIKYTKPGGTITLQVIQSIENESLSRYEFHIVDDGMGIKKQGLEHIFEPFERGETYPDSDVSGTGLGLAIVKSFVEIMGGTVKAESCFGKGSEFVLSIPFKVAEKYEAELTETLMMQDTCLMNKKALLVDDNAYNLEVLRELLQEEGMQIKTVSDGMSAISEMMSNGEKAYDVILMDIQMPHMNGYETAEAIRSLECINSQIPIVAMTATRIKDEMEEKGLLSGFVTKPYRVEEIKEVLCRVV